MKHIILVLGLALMLLTVGLSCENKAKRAAIRPQRATPVFAAAAAPSAADVAFRDCVETVPDDWDGPVFQLSHDYPTQQPPAPAGGYPWEAFDFKTQPESYLRALLDYARHDLEAVDWDPSLLESPNWFHAPWMAYGLVSQSGRECFHGMTRERPSRRDELWPGSPTAQNYAVGVYNNVGGWVFGQVWEDPADPSPDKSRFPNGSMAIKLLFTSATASTVPYLTGAKEWDTNVYVASQTRRVPRKLRLLQVDVAVRDRRNDLLTGWVFGTFVYNGNLPGTSVYDKLAPVGLMWGNDPTVMPATGGTLPPLQETWIHEPTRTATKQHLGCGNRLNGPVDNPRSSCLSCHATAEWETRNSMAPSACEPGTSFNLFFRNVPAGEPFDPDHVSLDYSLQMAVAMRNWNEWLGAQPQMTTLPAAAPSRTAFPVTRGEENE